MVTAKLDLMKGMHMYKIQTRLRDKWHCLEFDVTDKGDFKPRRYATLNDASLALERYIDGLFFANKEQVDFGNFRIVKD
jgi:hypothetical protein